MRMRVPADLVELLAGLPARRRLAANGPIVNMDGRSPVPYERAAHVGAAPNPLRRLRPLTASYTNGVNF